MHTVLTRKIKTSFRPLQSAITDHVFIRFIVNTIGGIGGYGDPGIGVPSVDDCEGGRWKTRIQIPIGSIFLSNTVLIKTSLISKERIYN